MRWLLTLVKGVLNVMAGVIRWATTHPVAAASVGTACLIAGIFIADGRVHDIVVSLGWFFLTTAATGWLIHLYQEGITAAGSAALGAARDFGNWQVQTTLDFTGWITGLFPGLGW